MIWDWALRSAAQTLRLSPMGISNLWLPLCPVREEKIRDAACPVVRAGLQERERGPGFQCVCHSFVCNIALGLSLPLFLFL